MSIFSNIDRSNLNGKDFGESDFEYLDQSARPAAQAVRKMLDEALLKFPPAHREELVTRLRGPDLQFGSATFELLLHELMIMQGWGVEIHPDLPNGRNRHPDFKVTTENGHAFYLEATLARQYSDELAARQRLQNQILRKINNLQSPKFLLHLEISGAPYSNVDPRNLYRGVSKWLSGLEADALPIDEKRWQDLPRYEYKHDGMTLKFRAHPRSKKTHGGNRRTIGSYSFGVRSINPTPSIRNAARKKAHHYGDLDLPLVVAINVESDFADNFQEVNALFGDEYYIIDRFNDEAELEPRREPNGVWIQREGIATRRLSAAWLFRNFNPWHLASRKINTLYVHPEPLLQIPGELLRFPHASVSADTGILVRNEGIYLSDILHLPESWPED